MGVFGMIQGLKTDFVDTQLQPQLRYKLLAFSSQKNRNVVLMPLMVVVSRPRIALLGKGFVFCLDGDERFNTDT